MTPRSRPVDVDDALLAAWPLPWPEAEGDKEERGAVLIVAGDVELPGAAVLAATAALRAGAGKLMVATARDNAALMGMALPEARVIALPQTAEGGIDASAFDVLCALGKKVDALLVGPGMRDEAAAAALVRAIAPAFQAARIVLDAGAMGAALGKPLAEAVVLTPHAGEMAHLTGRDKSEVQRDAPEVARDAARRWQVNVALKGAVTFVASPRGECWRHDGGNVGLATSGSGDVLAGLIVGLAARGASLAQSAVWGVALHARAGDRLAAGRGRLGYLARELSAEVPALMSAFASGAAR